jgi:hypothetical protein
MSLAHWICPHCGYAQTITSMKGDLSSSHIAVEGLAEGSVSLAHNSIGCSNPECRKLSCTVWLQQDHGPKMNYRLAPGSPIIIRRLLPVCDAKPQPDYIPVALREDYNEACAIRDLSPKASATLSRRCLQGMIRDFCGVRERTLNLEIKTLRKLLDEGHAPKGVTEETLDAIDQVRQVGNIGAHMEQDIDLIVPVEPGEAQILIELIEMLFADWYGARHNRQKRLAALAAIAAEKREFIANGGSQPISEGGEEAA